MFNSKTVFIIGAGASKEAGLPIGSELTKKIANLVEINADYGQFQSGDRSVYHAMVQLAQSGPPWDQNQFLGSGRGLAEAMELAVSIDTFLESHANNPEFVMVGKLGIARSISLAEKASKMALIGDRGQPLRIGNLAGTWYVSLARQLFTGIPAEHPESAFTNVSFIVFNYDRCLQIFLVRALEVYFRIDTNRAREIVKNVTIIHAYGTLGSIFPENSDFVSFSDDNVNIIDAAKRIRTFSESVDSAVAQSIKNEIRNASTHIFLGFGFHVQNMELLEPDDKHQRHSGYDDRAYATTCGLSDSDAQFVRDQIAMLLTDNNENNATKTWIYTRDCTCADLFQSYWRSLTA